MPWQDRIREAVYTAPSGNKFKFDFENVRRTTEKRTSAFSFIGVNESYIQDNGYGSRKYAMRCFFSGDNHDLVATAFEAALLESGVGELEHPLYGTFKVVPFGTISRRDDLVRQANQSVVECVFWTTTGVVYPTGERSPRNEVEASIDNHDVAAAESYADRMELPGILEQAELRGIVEGQLALANTYLRGPATATESVTREFRAWQQTINRSINVLVGNPFLLAQQLGNLIKAPARAVVGIENRLTSYVGFIRGSQTSPAGTPENASSAEAQPKRQVQLANAWRTADLTATYGLVATALAAIETEYKTRPEALSVASILLSELEIMSAWRDAGYAVFTGVEFGSQIQVIDDGRAWKEASNTIHFCVGYLLSLAFSLAIERTIVLDRPRTIIDLASELYGAEPDRFLDFLISSNDLTGAEIIELPQGHEIVWYPQ